MLVSNYVIHGPQSVPIGPIDVASQWLLFHIQSHN